MLNSGCWISLAEMKLNSLEPEQHINILCGLSYLSIKIFNLFVKHQTITWANYDKFDYPLTHNPLLFLQIL
jgi:hypothetical protein